MSNEKVSRFTKKLLEEQRAVSQGGTLSGRRARKATQVGHVGDDGAAYRNGKRVERTDDKSKKRGQSK